jgi:hypothetical protein
MGFWSVLLGGRRADAAPPPDLEPRDGQIWRCGILYRTSLPMGEIETWLESHAARRWKVSLEEMDDSLRGKVLRIMFESHEDKAAFARNFTRR